MSEPSVPSFLRPPHQRRRHRARQGGAAPASSPLVVLWLLRMLVPLGAHKHLVNRSGFSNDTVAEVVGLAHWVDPEDREFDPALVRTELRKLHAEAEEQADSPASPATALRLPPFLAHNIQRLSGLVGLSDTDQHILAFVVHLHSERVLDDTADWLGTLSSAKVFHALSVILDRPAEEVRTALGSQGVLARSGLVSVDRSGTSVLRSKLDLLSDNFADHISSHDADPITLLRDVVTLAGPATLALDDYAHIGNHLAVLQPYLRHALASGRKGVNIFVHGEPGTGKSQLVKVLARAMGCDLFEVASEDSDGDPVGGSRRLRAFRAAQSFFASRQALMLFDEVEDVFDDGSDRLGSRSTAQSHKAWINRTLEENPVPTFWLSNAVGSMDAAFIRRFDLVFELPVPPRAQRQRIVQAACGDLLPPAALQRIAESEVLAPAVVSRAASVVRSIVPEVGTQAGAEAFELMVNNTLQAQGHPVILRHDPTRLPEVYDPAFIRADVDLAALAQGLVRTRAGRLCLYGPPGTGKTAWGHWLAGQLGMPLLVRRASDLVSKYLGETEQNIARAFRQATQDGAVLLLDEVDSFLQDRRGAQRSWEVSQVNEMLTQMEAFAGVFIASTNLMTQLDQAALRRFDVKVRLDYLLPAQARELFIRHSKHMHADQRLGAERQPDSVARAADATACTPSASAKTDHPGSAPDLAVALERLARLHQLTPGDFAAVVRQSRLRPLVSPVDLVAALERECALKAGNDRGGQGGGMGFLG